MTDVPHIYIYINIYTGSEHVHMTMWGSLRLAPISLITRPFPSPVFDRLQYGNTEEEGLGDLVTCGYVRLTTEGRHMGDGGGGSAR